LIKFIVIFVFSFSVFAELTPDEEKKYDETDGIKFLEQLVQDQKYQEAIDLFKRYHPNEKNRNNYNLLIAKSYYHLKMFVAAKKVLQQSTSNFDQEYNFTRGLIAFELKEYEECVAILNRSLPKGLDTYLKCLESTNKYQEIYQAILTIPSGPEIDQLLYIKYLLKLNLFEEAKISVNKMMVNCPSLNLFLEIVEQVEKNKIIINSLYEKIHYCYPDQQESLAPFIKKLFSNNQSYSLQLQFQNLAALDYSYYQHSSEFLKNAGATESTYFQHLLNPDKKSYLQFKFQKSLEEEQLLKTKTISTENQENAYALAYANFLTNDAEKSLEILSGKKNKTAQESRLLELSQSCIQIGWRCRP
jgi:hypothetical protein